LFINVPVDLAIRVASELLSQDDSLEDHTALLKDDVLYPVEILSQRGRSFKRPYSLNDPESTPLELLNDA